MKIKFTKKVGEFISHLNITLEIGNNVVIINETVTDNTVNAKYNNGYFEIDGEYILYGKSFTRIKCPINKISDIEDYINFKC